MTASVGRRTLPSPLRGGVGGGGLQIQQCTWFHPAPGPSPSRGAETGRARVTVRPPPARGIRRRWIGSRGSTEQCPPPEVEHVGAEQGGELVAAADVRALAAVAGL